MKFNVLFAQFILSVDESIINQKNKTTNSHLNTIVKNLNLEFQVFIKRKLIKIFLIDLNNRFDSPLILNPVHINFYIQTEFYFFIVSK